MLVKYLVVNLVFQITRLKNKHPEYLYQRVGLYKYILKDIGNDVLQTLQR